LEPFSWTAVAAAAAKAAAGKVGGQLAGSAVQGVKKRVLGDPEQKAFAAALEHAYDRTLTAHRGVLAEFDVNPSFLQFEAAGELAKVLVPGAQPSSVRLAELCVDSLGPQPDDEVRWDRVVALRPAFRTLLEALAEEVGQQRALDHVMGRVAETRTAESAERLAERFGAAAAAETDQVEYLRWVLDQHRYLRTAGMVRNTMVQVPLRDVFVDLAAERDRRPGDRVEV
jgi:hypothetical protein